MKLLEEAVQRLSTLTDAERARIAAKALGDAMPAVLRALTNGGVTSAEPSVQVSAAVASLVAEAPVVTPDVLRARATRLNADPEAVAALLVADPPGDDEHVGDVLKLCRGTLDALAVLANYVASKEAHA